MRTCLSVYFDPTTRLKKQSKACATKKPLEMDADFCSTSGKDRPHMRSTTLCRNCVCMYVCVCVCVYVCVCRCRYVYVCMWVCMKCWETMDSRYTHTHTHTNTQKQTHTHTHTQNTDTHTHTHTNKPQQPQQQTTTNNNIRIINTSCGLFVCVRNLARCTVWLCACRKAAAETDDDTRRRERCERSDLEGYLEAALLALLAVVLAVLEVGGDVEGGSADGSLQRHTHRYEPTTIITSLTSKRCISKRTRHRYWTDTSRFKQIVSLFQKNIKSMYMHELVWERER